MATTVVDSSITVSWQELDGSPVETMSDGVFQATRRLLVDWGDRLTLMQELLGRTFASGDDTIVMRAHRYPAFTAAWAQSVRISPFHSPAAHEGAGAQVINQYANGAVVEVGYSSSENEDGQGAGPGDQGGDPLVTESIQPASEVLMLPGRQVKWATSGSHLMDIEAPMKLVVSMVWVYQRHKMPSLPDALVDYAGTVNSTAVTSLTLGKTFAAKTLLYEPAGFRRTIMPDEATAWEAELRMTHKPSGWQKFWDMANQRWDTLALISGGGALAPYETNDFNNLTV